MTMLKKYATRFQMVVFANGSRVVRLGADDYGLYGRGFRNDFGTSLMARGTESEVRGLVHDGRQETRC